jgi:hypothetical protein
MEEADGIVAEVPVRYVLSYHTLLNDTSTIVQQSII